MGLCWIATPFQAWKLHEPARSRQRPHPPSVGKLLQTHDLLNNSKENHRCGSQQCEHCCPNRIDVPKQLPCCAQAQDNDCPPYPSIRREASSPIRSARCSPQRESLRCSSRLWLTIRISPDSA